MDARLHERLEQVRASLPAWRERVTALRRALRVDERLLRRGEVEATMNVPGFWDQPERAQTVVKELKRLKGQTEPIEEARSDLEALTELLDMARQDLSDTKTLDEVLSDLERLGARIASIELTAMLNGPHDHCDAYVSVSAGAGGTDANDWAEMLLRQYLRYCERRGYKSHVIDHQPAKEAGIKGATVQVEGDWVFGYLQAERGVHRLVRMSPFNAGGARQTSFAAVDVVPVFDEEIEIEIKEGDLRIDTYRSQGAGGQHVNVTDSAVRITHLPTGIVVACQNERSQHSNRRTAMNMLRAKMLQMEEEKRQAEAARVYGEKGEIAWGNQIRSYVLQPYTQVKDRRTGHTVTDVQSVLDGELDPFIESFLRWRMAEEVEKG